MTGRTVLMLCATALCGFVAVSASPWARVVFPDPASHRTVTPRTPPTAETPRPKLPDGVSLARQCEGSKILARDVGEGQRMFYTVFAMDSLNRMIGEGCMRVAQGCNVCNVSYTGCTAEERTACTDMACLEKTCERKVICTAKRCTAQGDQPPPCTSRLARHTCLGPNALDMKASIDK